MLEMGKEDHAMQDRDTVRNNKMPEVATLLGVKIGERFRIKEIHNDYVWWFETDGLHGEVTAKGLDSLRAFAFALTVSDTLYKLLTGEFTIRRMPWRPRKGDQYWYVAWTDCGATFIHPETWRESFMDYLLLRSHNCFKTKDEAESHSLEIKKKYTGGRTYHEK